MNGKRPMFRVLLILTVVMISVILVFAQDQDTTDQEAPLAITFERGEGEVFSGSNIYILTGDKIERSFRSDYYLTEGSIVLEDGTWSLLAVGIGGTEPTLYATTDLEIDASPTRCMESLGDDWENAFTITCPLRFLRFELKTGVQLALLLVIQH